MAQRFDLRQLALGFGDRLEGRGSAQRGQHHRDREGFGLGLPLAQEIARAHGGIIAVVSDRTIGTVFSVDLPVAAAARA